MQPSLYPCPACGGLEFSAPPGSFEICGHCGWEDDAVQLANPTSGGGANGESLAAAQAAVLTGEPPRQRDPAWRALTPEELRYHRTACTHAQSPWPNPASTTPYWNCCVERVITVTDFCDGPRGGIAMFQGTPHFYQSRFDDMTDERCDVFDLWPLDDATFALACEDWEIWLRWQRAFHEGRVTIESHPALPEDRPRHEELERLLEGRLPPPTPPATQRSGEFQQELVRWSPVRRRPAARA